MKGVCVLLLLTTANAFHPDGVDHEADLQCHVCNASYYCLNGQQFDCPAHSLAAVALADTIEECVCLPGYLREGDLCNLGAPPAWYMYGNRSLCVHTRETIAAGASGHVDCVCVPGFAGLPAAEPVQCEACPADTFADVYNTSACVPCPEHASHNETRRANVTACLCDPGYTGPDGGPCVACAAGTFKAEPGAAACEDCGVNEYSYTAAAVCVACHANSSSLSRSPGVDHCLCDPGFYPSEGLCSMCHAGRFKNTTANEPCQSCTGNTFASELGATACTSCLVSSPFSTANPSEGGVRCQCIAGYTQTELNLVTPECSACPPDTFQPSQGQTTCELCDPNARSPEASVTPLACLCNAGFTDNSEHECLVCAGGTYKEAAADDEDDTQLCNVCPDDSFSLAQSGRLVDCLCDPGFSGPDGGPCSACAPGKFKAANGSAACEDCPLHTYSDAANSTACKSCTQFLDFGGITLAPGRDSSDDCECDVSQGFSTVYVGGARKCTGCKAGTYASAEGCRNCSNGTFNDEGAQTTCKQCPVNASSYDYPHVSCQCHKGFFCNPTKQLPKLTHDSSFSWLGNVEGGVILLSGTFGNRLVFAKASNAQNTWQYQEIATFFSTFYNLNFQTNWPYTLATQLPYCVLNMNIIPCQKIANSGNVFFDSPAILGSQRVFIFKWFILRSTEQGQYYLFQCGVWSEPWLQCRLFDGQYEQIGQSLPSSLDVIDLNFKSIHIEDPTRCSSGFCLACATDTFKDYTGGAAVCNACQMFSESLTASTSQDMCLCKRGYRQDGPTVCVACAAGTYSDDLDELACSVCPADTYTPTASYPWDTPGDCQACAVCNQTTNPAFRDHYDAARAGVGCGLDQATDCQPCPASASLFLPTTESQRNKGVESCVCDAHFYGAKGTACAACPSNQIRPDFIDAATTLADCLCAPGFEPDPGAVNLCRQCPIGTYKTYPGDHTCTACPATLTTEQTGNANASACVCAPGFAFNDDKCNICPDNLYKIGFNLIQTCTACTANSFGPAGGTGPMDCSCLFGFEPYTGMCIPCTPGKYKNETANIGKAMIAIDAASQLTNLARACSAGGCPVITSSAPDPDYPRQNIVDGITNNLFYTSQELKGWVVIDMQETRNVQSVRIYNRQDCCKDRIQAFQIRIGDSSTFSNNPLCGTYGTIDTFADFACVKSGRYLSVQNGIFEFFQLAEVEIYGTKPVPDEFKCLVCPLNTATNNTASPVCDACAAGKTTDGRTGQVECVCALGTEPGAEGVCQTCRAGTYKAASTDKYANRACVNCSSCAAGQQVATECNSTHNITCRACQANSWSSAGRTLLDPCFCNAGYELQGELCVACPVGKARQANANNSIRCATCGPGFANTSTQATCHPCSEICDDLSLYYMASWSRLLSCADVGVTDVQNIPQYDVSGQFWRTIMTQSSPLSAVMSLNSIPITFSSSMSIFFRYKFNKWVSTASDIAIVMWTPANNNAKVFQLYRWASTNEVAFYARSTDTGDHRINANNGGGISMTSPFEWVSVMITWNTATRQYIVSWKLDSASSCTSPCVREGVRTASGTSSTFFPGPYHIKIGGNPPTFGGDGNADVSVSHLFVSNVANAPWPTPANLMCDKSYVKQYVQAECNASRDVICQQCQTCPPGQYANNTCGVSYGNDRFDTQCSVCPADSYCPGGSVSQAALPCPVNARSLPGSHAITNCTCDPGFYRSGDLCVICPLDAYCPRGVFQPIACPAPGRTFYEGSAVRLDCHCPRGHFRDPPGDEERFNCSLCTPDDYCFNNSLYNCSDALMESEPGSGFFDNCTCVNRYYNNGTRCEDCNVDFSCVGGRQHACPALEWTNRLTRQEACVCRPSLVRAGAGAGAECVPCTDDFFCDGSDDRQHPCPSSSLGRAATNVSECLCNVSFEVVHSNNVSEPHSCRECSPHYFKNSVGNTLCQRCTRCLPASDSVWTRIVCDAGYDAMCDSCTVCHDPAAADTPAEQWAGVDCQEFADTVCFNCTLCDYSEQWEKAPCAETRDRECSAIQRGRPCEVGQYAGNHSRTTDSQCLPCAMNDTLYEGQRLHFYTSAGRRYDDLTSCDIACRPFSRLRDVANPALGCVSCETGNVLFKVFTQNDLACTFTCLEGYVRTDDDCVLAPIRPSVSSYWNHSLNVTHVRRVAVGGAAAFRFTVSHAAHGSFAVVVGREEPSCAGRAPIVLRGSTACCFAGLWRVSTKNQLGLGSSAEETCSAPAPPPSARLSDTQLEFDVPDSRLPELALCEVALNTSFGELACVLRVSIVDAVLLHHFSVAVRLELRRGAALAFLPGAHTYVPLLSFRAEVQLAYTDNGRPVFLVVSDLAPLPAAGATAVLLSSGLERVEPPPEMNCRRYAGHAHNASVEAWTLEGAPVRSTTFLRAPAGTAFLKLYYTLRLLEREGSPGEPKNTMNVAVWRNLSLAHAVCDAAPLPQATRIGEVLSCSGLGAAAVAGATALQGPTETVHGELGGLTSFVARALHAHVRQVRAASMLAAFALPPDVPLLAANVSAMLAGYLDFTESFRAACGASVLCHFQYVHGRGVHFLSSCDSAAQDAARDWLRTALGVVHDTGHVQALCGLAQQHARPYAFLIALVNTRAYLPRTVQWHDLQNHSAPLGVSRVASLFEFS